MICEIERTFIRKLENSGLYKEPVDGLLPQLSRRFPSVTDIQADQAAEHIIRTHGSGAFPKYPACEKALKLAIAGEVVSAEPQAAGRSEGISANNYFEACQRWKGKHPGSDFLVISQSQDAAAWETWIIYFRQIGLPSNANLMSQPREAWTVPTLYPDMFDRNAPPPLTDEQVAEIRGYGKRARTHDEIQRAKRQMEDFHRDIPRRKQKERVTRQHLAEGAFDRWAAEQASASMPQASAELTARIQQEKAA